MPGNKARYCRHYMQQKVVDVNVSLQLNQFQVVQFPLPNGHLSFFFSLQCCKYTKVGKASRFIQKPTHLARLSSGRLIMNSGWIWNSHERNKFLMAKASRDILKFRVSKMALKEVFKRCFPPQTPCCCKNICKTGNNAVKMSQVFHVSQIQT